MDQRAIHTLGANSLTNNGGSDQKLEAVSSQPYFDPQIVVSRDALGRPVSIYGQDSWDYRSLSPDGKTSAMLHFFGAHGHIDRELTARIREQHKALIWLHMDSGRMRSIATVKCANNAANSLCQKAHRREVDLFALLSNVEWLADELESINTPNLRHTSSLLKTLWRNRSVLGLEIEIPLQRLKAAIHKEGRARPEGAQTPLIPSRVYCSMLAGLLALLGEIERNLEVVLHAYRQSKTASPKAPAVCTAARKKRVRARVLVPVVESMKALGYDPDAHMALDSFVISRINLYQSALMHTVAAFTGMRLGEVRILPLHDVLEAFKDRGNTHCVIKGYTYKLNKGVRRPTSWITSREGHRAVLLAQRIAMTILSEVGGEPSAGTQALLFSSTEDPFRAKGYGTIYVLQQRLLEIICPVTTQEDIDELNRLELDRGWQHDGIEAGKRWPLAFHQLRRSLSVYAHRSGMVSLLALKAQLQHITDEMRAYYADGYTRAINLVFDEEHFSHEWNAAKAESSFFGYVMGLLFSEEDLLGQGAERMSQTIVSRTRQETLKLFKEGKLAYRETVLGGCVSIEECKALPLEPIPFDCLKTNCVNLVVFSKRLDHVVRSQETTVAMLECDERGSVEHRLEANNLRVLLKARQQLAKAKT